MGRKHLALSTGWPCYLGRVKFHDLLVDQKTLSTNRFCSKAQWANRFLIRLSISVKITFSVDGWKENVICTCPANPILHLMQAHKNENAEECQRKPCKTHAHLHWFRFGGFVPCWTEQQSNVLMLWRLDRQPGFFGILRQLLVIN